LAPENRALGDLAESVLLNGYDEEELVGKIEDADAIVLLQHERLLPSGHLVQSPRTVAEFLLSRTDVVEHRQVEVGQWRFLEVG
jgi:hypothetical protein